METRSSLNYLTTNFQATGFAVVSNLYPPLEVAAILQCVKNALFYESSFGKNQEVFAIRGLLDEIPDLWPLLDTVGLRMLLAQVFPQGCHLAKAMYFDKPSLLNWRVAWHQDVMINVNGRMELPGFGPWTSKAEGVSVQPPVAVLENMCTLRIHLDDCDAGNGALKVVPGSHQLGVLPLAALAEYTPEAVGCEVPAGGVMLMRPLLLHASNRNTTDRPRRVLHLEFASTELPAGLQWRERRAVALPQVSVLNAPTTVQHLTQQQIEGEAEAQRRSA